MPPPQPDARAACRYFTLCGNGEVVVELLPWWPHAYRTPATAPTDLTRTAPPLTPPAERGTGEEGGASTRQRYESLLPRWRFSHPCALNLPVVVGWPLGGESLDQTFPRDRGRGWAGGGLQWKV